MLRLTWLGHSTVLLELDGQRLLTDPLLRNRLAILRRVEPLGASHVPEVDAVLVSHVHWDHLDVPSLRRLGRSTRLIVPRGAERALRRRGFANVGEIASGERVDVGSVSVRATDAEHSARLLPGGRLIPSLGYLVWGSTCTYFAGDTDLFDGMSRLAPRPDVALLPVAGWGPRLPAGHLDPARAAQAVTLLRPRIAIPIHWGTYRRLGLSVDTEALRGPAEAFAREVARVAPAVRTIVLPPGGATEIET